MININLYLFTIILIALSGCEEEPPAINYLPPTSTYDTTFIAATVPPAQTREVLLEDVTGVSCPNCPEAAGIAKDIIAANPGRVNVVAMYSTISRPLTDPINHPPVVSAYDFRSELVTAIKQMVAIPGSLPMGYIDRKVFSGKTDPAVPRDEWAGAVNEELAIPTPVNILLTADYNESTKELTTEVEVTYTQNVTGINYISICMIEDSIIDAQESKDLITGAVTYIPDYVHRHVLRDMYTAAVGDILNTSNQITLSPGRVIRRRYTKKFEKLVPYSHIKVLAYVHNDPSSKYVLQSKEVDVH